MFLLKYRSCSQQNHQTRHKYSNAGCPEKVTFSMLLKPKNHLVGTKIELIKFKHSSHFPPQQKRQRVNRTSRPASQSKTSKLQWSGELPGIFHVSTPQVVKIRNPILSLQGSPGSPLLRKIRRQHHPPTPLHITYITSLNTYIACNTYITTNTYITYNTYIT